MIVRILRSKAASWYKEYIGQTFEVEDKMCILGGKTYHILTEDLHKNPRRTIATKDFEIIAEF